MLPPASGTGQFLEHTRKVIRFARKGCTNRPFFHIVIAESIKSQEDTVIEQVGSYDPLANSHDEQLCSMNIERIRHWLGRGADVSRPVAQLFGLSGLFPVHPTSYMTAWRNRETLEKKTQEEKAETKEA